MLLKGGVYVKYKLQGDYLTLIIDDDFHHKTIRDIFNYLHLSKKTIHLLKQDKNYTLNNLISTRLLIGRIPTEASLLCIHSGDGPILIFFATLAQ